MGQGFVRDENDVIHRANFIEDAIRDQEDRRWDGITYCDLYFVTWGAALPLTNAWGHAAPNHSMLPSYETRATCLLCLVTEE